MDAEKKKNIELLQVQDEINTALFVSHQRLLTLLERASILGSARQWKFTNALLSQFNRRARAYAAAMSAIGDTFEEILDDSIKDTTDIRTS